MSSKTGVYYAVIKTESRRKVRSLRTKDYATAARKLPETLSALRALAGYLSEGGEIPTFRQAVSAYSSAEQIPIKKTSCNYYQQSADAILRVATRKLLDKP